MLSLLAVDEALALSLLSEFVEAELVDEKDDVGEAPGPLELSHVLVVV